MKTIIFVLALLVLVPSTQVDVIATIKKIDKSPFGRTVFDTIWLELQTGDPLDRLLQTLKIDILLNKEKMMSEIKNIKIHDISSFDKDLAQSNRKKIELKARLEGQLYPQRGILQGLVAQKSSEVKGYQQDLEELDPQRAEENTDFEENFQNIKKPQVLLLKPEDYLLIILSTDLSSKKEKLQNNQLTNSPKRLLPQSKSISLNLLRKQLNSNTEKDIVNYSKLLPQIASKVQQLADAGAVSKIIDLAVELLAKIADSLSLLRFAEAKRVEAYKKSRNSIVISITVARITLANTQSNLASLKDVIAQVEATLDTTNQRIENVSAGRNDRFNQCEEAVQDYQDARTARTSDRDIVSQTIGLVNKELRTLREQLVLRQSAGEEK